MGKSDRRRASDASCLVEMRESHGRLVAVFDCKGCARESDLASEACWRGVTGAISHSSSLDSIVLAGHEETEYAGPGLEAMERLRRAGASAMRFASRAAPSDSKSCALCALNPSKLFAGCADGLAGGVRTGHAALAKAGSAMMASPPAQSCQACFKASEKDLAYLWGEYRAICDEIMREAYGIVGGSE